MIYLVLILVVLVAFLLFAAMLNVAIYAISFWISVCVGGLFARNKEKFQALSQSALLAVATIVLFIFSYRGCSYVNPYDAEDYLPAVGGCGGSFNRAGVAGIIFEQLSDRR